MNGELAPSFSLNTTATGLVKAIQQTYSLPLHLNFLK